MTAKVLVRREGRAGIISLNRPEAINALDLEMVLAIGAALEEFLGDTAIGLVLFEGNGPRGFCAGGDMRAVRQMVLEGDFEGPRKFFETEYAMNFLIDSAPKPVVVLTHGVVMGGGIGIAGHAHFRFSTPDVRFAMPEAAIGLHCDTGVNAILAMAEPHRALAFCLAGEPVGVDAARGLGLTDCVITHDILDHVRAQIIAAAGAGDPKVALTSIMQSHDTIAQDSGYLSMVDALAPAFEGETAKEIVSALADRVHGDAGQDLLAAINQRCPTTLEVIVQSLHAARRHLDLEDVLARDLRLSEWMISRQDFAEGVRAVLVDKDRNPSWHPAKLTDVDIAAVSDIISG